MKTLIQPLLIFLCLNLSFLAVAQTGAQSDPEPVMPNAFLRVGVHLPWGRILDQPYRFDLAYEHILSPRLTASASLTSYNRFGDGFSPDVVKRGNSSVAYHDVLLGLDLGLTYYLSKGKYSGHYLSFVVKDALAYTGYSSSPSWNVFTSSNGVEALPRVGVYYGYRKQFGSGWFLDGRIGFVPNRQVSSKIYNYEEKPLDFKLSFGYTIPFRKKKK